MADRGYVITGDESFLGRYGAAADQIRPLMESLRALTADNPSQQQRIRLLTPLIEQKLDFFSAIARVRRTQGFAAAQPMLLTPQGAPLLVEIQGTLGEMTGEENSLLGTRLRGAESDARRSILLVVGGSFFSGCLICLAGWTVYRDGAARARAEETLVAVDEELRQTADRFRSLVESAKEYAISCSTATGSSRPGILAQSGLRDMPRRKSSAGTSPAFTPAKTSERKNPKRNSGSRSRMASTRRTAGASVKTARASGPTFSSRRFTTAAERTSASRR